MEKITEKNPTPTTKYYYALMRAAYLIESQDWDAALKSFNMEEINPVSRAANIYANASKTLKKNKNISNYIKELEKITEMNVKITPDYFTSVAPNGKLIAKIVLLELRAQIEFSKGKSNEAIKLLQKAALLENQIPAGYGPPTPVKPAHELLADLLYIDGRYLDAYNEYHNVLERFPNRMLSNRGISKTIEKLKSQGKNIPKKSAPYFNKLMKLNCSSENVSADE